MLGGDLAQPKFLAITDPQDWEARSISVQSSPQHLVMVGGKCIELLVDNVSMHLQVGPCKPILVIVAEAALWGYSCRCTYDDVQVG